MRHLLIYFLYFILSITTVFGQNISPTSCKGTIREVQGNSPLPVCAGYPVVGQTRTYKMLPLDNTCLATAGVSIIGYNWSITSGNIVSNNTDQEVEIEWTNAGEQTLMVEVSATDGTDTYTSTFTRVLQITAPITYPDCGTYIKQNNVTLLGGSLPDVYKNKVYTYSFDLYGYCLNAGTVFQPYWCVKGGEIIGSATNSSVQIKWNELGTQTVYLQLVSGENNLLVPLTSVNSQQEVNVLDACTVNLSPNTPLNYSTYVGCNTISLEVPFFEEATYEWYKVETNGNLTLVNNGVNSYAYYPENINTNGNKIRVRILNPLCESRPELWHEFSIQVLPIPDLTVLPQITVPTNCGNKVISYSGVPNGVWYWQTSPTGISNANPTTLTVTQSGIYYLRNVIQCPTGGWIWGNQVITTPYINITPAPAAPINTTEPATIRGAGSLVLTVTGGKNGYQWCADANCNTILATGNHYTVELTNGETKPVWVRSLTDEAACPHSAILQIVATSISIAPLPALSQPDMNYITVTVPLVPITEVEQIASLNAHQVSRSTTYFDGLGREIQSVATQASPTLKDVVQPTEYDAFGRILKSYLPYTGGNTGAYQPDALTPTYTNSKQFKFYNENVPVGVTPDAAPFAKVEYENSPMNRVVKSWGVGKTWHDENRFVSADFAIYQQNENDLSYNVPKWEYNFDTDQPQFTGFYPNNSLIIHTTIDEDGTVVKEFQNAQGQVVLKRGLESEDPNAVLTTMDKYLETMYVYDDFGQLRFIIPPTAVYELRKNIVTIFWNLNASCGECGTKSLLETYCYKYSYDERGRVTEVREPQKEVEYTVYDELNRPILYQDANIRNAQNTMSQPSPYRWAYTKYDILGRTIYTGLVELKTSDRIELQTLVNNFFNAVPEAEKPARLYEVFDKGILPHAYTENRAFPDLTDMETVDNFETLEYLTVTYYDDYKKIIEGGIPHQFQSNSYNNTFFNRMTGRTVGTKVKVLDAKRYTNDAKWLYTVPFYDDRGRVIQMIAENALEIQYNASTPNAQQKNVDVMDMKYDYLKVLEDRLIHKGGSQNPLTVVQKYGYDGNTLHSVYHTITHEGITYPTERLATYKYNEVGQVISKTVANAKIQNIDYTFNIRGALTRINEINAMSNDLFAFQLVYEDIDTQINGMNGDSKLGERRYNGMIAGQKWKSSADNQTRGYAYKYDKLGRLTEARYKNFGNPASPEKFSVFGITYDKNSNIRTMKREGVVNIVSPTSFSFGVVDDLTYKYKGNQIINIKDVATADKGIAGDFQDRDATNAGVDEYFYDDNGNLTRDDNKKITTIRYTELGKVESVQYADGSGLAYLYDALGIKLKKITFDASTNETTNTQYVGGFIYQGKASTDGELQFIATSEGKAIAPRQLGNSSQAFAYEYNYTDHLGNMRMTFRESTPTTYEATMELAYQQTERREFANIDITRDNTKAVPNTLGRSSSARVNGAENKPLGPWKSIPVVKGDKISVNTQAYTEAMPQNAPNIWLSLASLLANTTVIDQYGIGTDGKRPFNPALLLGNLNLISLFTNPNPAGNNMKLPVAYLRIVEYNEQGQIVGHEHRFVSMKSVWHGLRIDNYIAKGKGRIEVFVANESGTAVWFDEMSITHTPTLIAQETHYDPWGLELVGIGAQGFNRFTFNAQSEKQKELGGNKGYLFETDWRGYDPQTGRFWQIDKLASEYHNITPYHFALNNPISWNDPTGLEVPGPRKEDPKPTLWQKIKAKIGIGKIENGVYKKPKQLKQEAKEKEEAKQKYEAERIADNRRGTGDSQADPGEDKVYLGLNTLETKDLGIRETPVPNKVINPVKVPDPPRQQSSNNNATVIPPPPPPPPRTVNFFRNGNRRNVKVKFQYKKTLSKDIIRDDDMDNELRALANFLNANPRARVRITVVVDAPKATERTVMRTSIINNTEHRQYLPDFADDRFKGFVDYMQSVHGLVNPLQLINNGYRTDGEPSIDFER